MSGYIAVKNFEKHQHYKDRTPPWIKLYNDLLDDYDFSCLQDASKLHLVMIWLLASRYENRIPNDPQWIARRINASDPVDIAALVSAGFITVCDDASEPLAERKQDAMLEVEVEREKEVEKETEEKNAASGAALVLMAGEIGEDPHEPLTGADVLATWLNTRKLPVSPAEKAKQGAAARDIAKAHTPQQIAAAFIGIGQLFPHSKGEPWDLFDLKRKFTKAVEAALNHPQVREQRAWAEFDNLRSASGWQ